MGIDALAPAAGTGPGGPRPVHETLTAALGRVRLLAAAAAALLGVRAAAAGPADPAGAAWTAALLALLAATHAVPRLRPAGRAAVARDVVVFGGAAWALGPGGPAWPLLVVPVLAAAIEDRRRGALAVGGVLAAAHVATGGPGAATHAAQAAAVLAAALPGAYLAEHLAVEIYVHRWHRRDAERRGAMLRTVAAAGRRMAQLDAAAVERVLLDTGRALGLRDARIVAGPPAPDAAPLAVQAATEQRVVTARPRQAGDPWAVAVPVGAGDGPVEVLTGALAGPPAVPLLEALDLLGAEAGAALGCARAHAAVEHASRHDGLTGLPNRAQFLERLAAALAAAEAADSPAAVLFVDLDGFKAVNDTYGHDAGNALLVAVAGRLRRAVPEPHLVARLAGDEFAAVLDGAGAAEATAVAERIRAALRDPFAFGGTRLAVTASIGVGVRAAGDAPADVLRRADLAMYRAKDGGRDRVALAGS